MEIEELEQKIMNCENIVEAKLLIKQLQSLGVEIDVEKHLEAWK